MYPAAHDDAEDDEEHDAGAQQPPEPGVGLALPRLVGVGQAPSASEYFTNQSFV